MCFDEGTLQAYLDGEIDEALKDQIKSILICVKNAQISLMSLKI